MPRVKLTKSAIDALPTLAKDIVFWDSGCPGFGVKVTQKGRKVFIVLYRVAGRFAHLFLTADRRCTHEVAALLANGPRPTSRSSPRFIVCSSQHSSGC
jgi:hypothetical protein